MSDPDALARLLAEQIPTGRFGGPYRPPPRPREPMPATSPEDAEQHAAALERELEAYEISPHARAVRRRHLEAVPDPEPGQPAA